MYPIDVGGLRSFLDRRFRASARPLIPRTVWLLGLVSCFTDISSEMISSILPVYLFVHLQLSAVQFGVIDGLYQGVTAVARLASGVVADRWRQYKLVATLGYGLSAICKIGLLVTGNAWTAVAAILSADRLGKGIRTAPRDALISLATRPQDLGSAFGVHRALDTVGVLVGPLLAFWILSTMPNRFDAIFVVSFAIALIGIAALVLLVDDRRGDASGERHLTVDLPGLLRNRQFVAITTAAALTSFVVVSDAFLYLLLQWKRGSGAETIPLLYAGTATSYLVLAAPLGRLADAVGRSRVFVIGQACIVLVYAGMATLDIGLWTLGLVLLLHGAYYAATDGVIAALVSSATRAEVRASGLATINTATSLMRLASSVIVGVIWSWRGPGTVVMLALFASIAAMALSSFMLKATNDRPLETGTA
ncbi:MAG TPA: MFS transporter [Vicinamibacterales bacterium]